MEWFLGALALSFLLAVIARAPYKRRGFVKGKPIRRYPKFLGRFLFFDVVVSMVLLLALGTRLLVPYHDLRSPFYLVLWLAIFVAILGNGRKW